MTPQEKMVPIATNSAPFSIEIPLTERIVNEPLLRSLHKKHRRTHSAGQSKRETKTNSERCRRMPNTHEAFLSSSLLMLCYLIDRRLLCSRPVIYWMVVTCVGMSTKHDERLVLKPVGYMSRIFALLSLPDWFLRNQVVLQSLKIINYVDKAGGTK